MQLIITQQLAQATVDYLTKQPYGEVAGLVQQFTRLMPYEEKNVPLAAESPTTPEAPGKDGGDSAEESATTPEKEG